MRSNRSQTSAVCSHLLVQPALPVFHIAGARLVDFRFDFSAIFSDRLINEPVRSCDAASLKQDSCGPLQYTGTACLLAKQLGTFQVTCTG